MEQLFIENLIASHPFFTLLSPEEVKSLAPLFKENHFKAGDIIAKEGEIVDYIYLIGSGIAEVRRQSITQAVIGEVKVARLSAGEAIGLMETGLFSTTGFRAASVYAVTDLVLYKIGIKNITNFLNSTKLYANFTKSTDELLKMHLIKQITPLSKLSNNAISFLLKNIKYISYAKDEYIYHQGDYGEECFIIESGMVDIRRKDIKTSNEMTICTLNPGMLFGEMVALTNAMHRDASAIALQDCELFSINKNIILKVLHEEGFIDEMKEFLALSNRPEVNTNVCLKRDIAKDGSEIIVLTNSTTNESLYLTPLELKVWQDLSSDHQTLNSLLNKYNEQFKHNETLSLKRFLLNLVHLDFIKTSSMSITYQNTTPFYKNLFRYIINLFTGGNKRN